MEHLSTVIAIPVFLLLILIEYFSTRKAHPEYYRLNDALTNLNVGVSHLLFKLLTTGLMFGAYVWVKDHFALVHLTGFWAYAIVFVLFDCCLYLAHGYGHEFNLFWGAHIVHHQSEEYNLTVALRQSWIHSLLAFIFFLPIAFLGVDILTLGIVASLNSFYQFWIHTKAVQRMPKWFEAIFNSPAHHRVHHGVNPKYIDKNHAGMFIIWDKMFGTFQEEEEEPTYGITKPMNSWNPAWSNVHYYVEMYQSGKKMKNIKDKLKLVFARPGWQPDYLGGQIKVTEPDVRHQKYDLQAASRGLNIYVLVQFAFIIIGLSAYLYHFEKLSLFFQVLAFAVLMLSTVICSAILEQKTWVKYAEYFRLMLAIVGLNSLYYINFNSWFYVVLIPSLLITAYFIVWYTMNIHNRHLIKEMAVKRS